MKHTLIARLLPFALLIALVSPLAAQPGAGPGPGGPGGGPGMHMRHGPGGPGFGDHEQRFDFLAERLQLSDAQIQEWEQLRTEFRATIDPLHERQQEIQELVRTQLEGDSPDAQAIGELVIAGHGLRAQIGAAFDAHHDAFLAILTPEQRETLESLRDEHPGHGPGGPGPGSGGHFRMRSGGGGPFGG